MDTHLHSAQIRVERKYLTFDLKENPSGTFLRITEEGHSGHRNSIVIPATGLELFRDSLNEVVQFSRTLPQGQSSDTHRIPPAVPVARFDR